MYTLNSIEQPHPSGVILFVCPFHPFVSLFFCCLFVKESGETSSFQFSPLPQHSHSWHFYNVHTCLILTFVLYYCNPYSCLLLLFHLSILLWAITGTFELNITGTHKWSTVCYGSAINWHTQTHSSPPPLILDQCTCTCILIRQPCSQVLYTW